MKTPEVGRTLPLSVPRRVVCDLLAYAKTVPGAPEERRMNVTAVAALRSRMALAPGWCAIFTKAYGITAARFPELRRAYIPFPRPYLYEHPFSIASVSIEREYRGENAVFWVHLRGPEGQPLQDLQAYLRRFKEEPLESIGLYRRALFVGRLPRPLRRLIWWIGLNSSGPKRASRMGTFGVSTYSGLGAQSLHPISPLTGTLNYGPVGADGAVTARIVYDQRVLDGPTAARALACMEGVLNQEIVAELRKEMEARAA